MTVVGRLRGRAILGFVVAALAALVVFVREEFRGSGFAGTLLYHLLGILTGPVVIGVAAALVYLFLRMWRQRKHYLRHDGVMLFRGSGATWPLASVRDVRLTRNWLGIRSLRIDVGDGAGAKSPELAKAYMLVERPEAVRDAIVAAVAQAGG